MRTTTPLTPPPAPKLNPLAHRQAALLRLSTGIAAAHDAVGVVLFEVLTGEPPLNAPSVMALFAKVLSEHPRRPSELVASVPPGLDELIGQLLAKEPADRVPSAAVLVERLQALA